MSEPPSSAALARRRTNRSGASNPPAPATGVRLRQSLVVLLAVVSGATDAIGLIALGGAFTSVMTGNLVLLGAAASSADGQLALAAGGAILAFCLGAAIGARLAGSPAAGDRTWPRHVTLGLSVEMVLFLAYAIGWWVSRADPGPVLTLALLLCTAAGMGIQSSTVQRFGVSGLSTTYLTGTLTTVVIRLATGRGFREVHHSLEILVGLVAGAAAGAGLLAIAPMTAPLLQLIGLAAVLALAVGWAHKH